MPAEEFTLTGTDVADRVRSQFGDVSGAQLADTAILRWINDGQREIVNSNPILRATKLSDINAQPTIMSRSLVQSWKSPPADFSLDLYAYVVARRNSATIGRFPVNFSTRVAGVSKWNNGILSRFRMIWRTIKFAIRLKRELKR